MMERLKALFYKITKRDPLGVNRFIGTWEAARQSSEERKCVFVLDETTWTVYYDGEKITPPTGDIHPHQQHHRRHLLFPGFLCMGQHHRNRSLYPSQR